MGNPELRRVAETVARFGTAELESLVTDLWDTMAARGGIGLAATQIGVPLRVVVFGMEEDPSGRGRSPVPRTVLVNPLIQALDDKLEEAWEGCLSVPGLRGVVPRAVRIRYRGADQQGNAIEREVEGFHARVVQHECDHLDGILYPQRMRDMATLGFEEEVSLAGSLSELEHGD